MYKIGPHEICGDRTALIDYETEYHGGSFDVGMGIEITGKLPHKTEITVDSLPPPAYTVFRSIREWNTC